MKTDFKVGDKVVILDTVWGEDCYLISRLGIIISFSNTGKIAYIHIGNGSVWASEIRLATLLEKELANVD